MKRTIFAALATIAIGAAQASADAPTPAEQLYDQLKQLFFE